MSPLRRDMKPVTVDILSSPDGLISLGLVPGVSHINKFGRNSLIDAATVPEDIWDVGGVYVPPTAPRIHNLRSYLMESL